MERDLYLVLENGEVFRGKRFGAEGEAAGEVVFHTGMVGYLETLTDPGYCGQIVVQTFPLIGNYGLIPDEQIGDRAYLKAYIVREWCQSPSNYRSEGTVDAFLKQQGVVGLYDIDTRKLTRILRENGTMKGALAESPERAHEVLTAFIKEDKATEGHASKVELVTRREVLTVPAKGETRFRVAVMDYGCTRNLVRMLTERGMEVTLFPAGTAALDVLVTDPDGIILSNGPFDPEEDAELIFEAQRLVYSGKPLMGVDFGHLLLALARGARMTKLKHGHRGANQPVKHLPSDRVYIASHAQGYAIDADFLPMNAWVTFENLNDKTVEGLQYTDIPAFSVQFIPEDGRGKSTTGFLFDQFEKFMKDAQ